MPEKRPGRRYVSVTGQSGCEKDTHSVTQKRCGTGIVRARTRAEGPPQLSATVKRSFLLRGRAASAVGSRLSEPHGEYHVATLSGRALEKVRHFLKPAPGVPALVGAVLRVAVVEWHRVVAHAELGFGDFRQVRGDFGDPIGCQVGDELVVGVGVEVFVPQDHAVGRPVLGHALVPHAGEGAQDRIPRLVRVARELGSARLLDVSTTAPSLSSSPRASRSSAATLSDSAKCTPSSMA